MMFTTDLALKVDPIYREITQGWLEDPQQFEGAFARAWYKLTHRDLGPTSRYLGEMVPDQTFVWQDPVPEADYAPINDADVSEIKNMILDSGPERSATGAHRSAASASSYRETDMRGGANGARVRLAPQNSWEANNPEELNGVIAVLEGIQEDFNAQSGNRQVSLADVIVLGGAAAIEQAAGRAGHDVEVPFFVGRTDASQEQTDVESFLSA